MEKIDLDNLLDWVRYTEADDAVAISARVVRSLAEELKAARRVVDTALIYKGCLEKDGYAEIHRDLSDYEEDFGAL